MLAKVVDGVLVIRGDENANAITIDTNGLEPGTVRIAGQGETTVNGEGTVILSGVTRDVRVHLRGGGDSVAVRNAQLSGGLRIGSGEEADQVLIQDVKIKGDLEVFTRGGNDDVNLLGVAVRGKTLVGTAAGGDVFTAEDSSFRGGFILAAGVGNDTVQLMNSTFGGAKRISAGPGQDLVNGRVVTDLTDFGNGLNGWTGGFADYGKNMGDLRLKWGLQDLPEELEQDGKGFYIQGMNRSDDLLMYLTRTLAGLKANTEYQVRFDLTFASNAGSNCFGVGGAPGESVYLKAGAATKKPATTTDDEQFVEVNFDKGQQSNGGKNASVVGDISNGTEDCSGDGEFVTLKKQHVHAFRVRTDAKGRLHLVVATDSAYEGFTRLYYQQVKARLVEVAKQD